MTNTTFKTLITAIALATSTSAMAFNNDDADVAIYDEVYVQNMLAQPQT